MFVLYKTVERPGGLLETLAHGLYESRAEAEQIADNLRLLYSWIKAVRVDAYDAAEPGLPLSRKKMAASILPEAERQRKSS